MSVQIQTPANKPSPPAAPTAPVPVKHRYLELALYKNYMRMGQKFEIGKVYQFTPEQAVILLGEQDAGRAIWKVYRKPRPEPTPLQKIESNIMDASKLEVKQTYVDDTMPTIQALEIGNDEEIADIIESIEDGVEV